MRPGDEFGPYRIVKVIGRGAMGEVYLASRGDEQVAIKVVYHGSDPEDEQVLEAERVGAELQKKLASVDSRVVRVRWFGQIKDDLVIEMEYIEGEDLSMVLSRGPLGPGRVAVIGIELCEMLENLHAFTTEVAGQQFLGVIHGDLKPRNIRLDTAGRVKVLDFGIAKALSYTRKYTQNVFASTAYCSPERLETQSMDAQSDLWSVGVLLYQMMAGRLPFNEPTKERLERRIRSWQPPDPLPAECPAGLRDIIFTMLARDPACRIQTVREAREDLERFIRGQPVLSHPPEAAAFENDATMRTTAADPMERLASGNGDETVRTAVAEEDLTVRTSAPAEEPAAAHKPRPFAVRIRGNRGKVLNGCLMIAGLVAVGAMALAGQQFWVWNEGKQLEKDLETERVTDLNQGWERYRQLDSHSHIPFLLWGARRSLKARLLTAGDEVIREYRDADTPTVRENQWKQALTWFSHALETDPADKAVLGRMRLCEAHIERINATGVNRARNLNLAVMRFNEAADLLKRSPDPYLGLVRIYVYELNNMEKAEEALNKAAAYGHPAGNREKAQLADGYKRSADRIWRDAGRYASVPDQEKEYLEKAKKDYERALDLYQQVGLWGDAAAKRRQALQSLQAVENRLRQLHKGWWPF